MQFQLCIHIGYGCSHHWINAAPTGLWQDLCILGSSWPCVSFPVCSTSSSPPCFWLPRSPAMSVFGGGVLSSPWLGLFVFSHIQHEGLMSEEANTEWHIKRKWGFAGWVVTAQVDGGGAAPREAERNGAHQVESTWQSEGRLWKEWHGKSKCQQSVQEGVTVPLVHAVSPSSCHLLCEISLK